MNMRSRKVLRTCVWPETPLGQQNREPDRAESGGSCRQELRNSAPCRSVVRNRLGGKDFITKVLRLYVAVVGQAQATRWEAQVRDRLEPNNDVHVALAIEPQILRMQVLCS